jgi:hypothetical protein
MSPRNLIKLVCLIIAAVYRNRWFQIQSIQLFALSFFRDRPYLRQVSPIHVIPVR